MRTLRIPACQSCFLFDRKDRQIVGTRPVSLRNIMSVGSALPPRWMSDDSLAVDRVMAAAPAASRIRIAHVDHDVLIDGARSAPEIRVLVEFRNVLERI
jgi:hypothetical protein